jgi:hypothetical protein
VTGHIHWIELAAAGMSFAGLAMAGWYTGAKYAERVRRRADAQLAMLDEPPEMAVQLLGSGWDADDESETGPEELIGSEMAWFADPVLAAAGRRWRRLRSGLRPAGWLGAPFLALAALAWLVLFLALTVLLLPVTVAKFLLNGNRDFRLRLIVLAFVFGTALEITAALQG